jgi:hypothetical protein
MVRLFYFFLFFIFYCLGIARAATSRPDLPQIIPLLGILQEFGVTWTDLYLRIPIVVRYVIFRTFSILSETLSSAPLPSIPASLPLLGISDEGSVVNGGDRNRLSESTVEILDESSVEVVTNSHKKIKYTENMKISINNDNDKNNENEIKGYENIENTNNNVYQNNGNDDDNDNNGRVRGVDDGDGEGAGSDDIKNENGSVVDTDYDNGGDNNNYNNVRNEFVTDENDLINNDNNKSDDKNEINDVRDNVSAVISDPRPTLLKSASTSVSSSVSTAQSPSPPVSPSPSVSVSVSSSQSSILALLRVMVKMHATRSMIGDKAIMKIAETINLVLNSYEFSTSFSTFDNSETSKSYQKLSILVTAMIASSARNKIVPIVLSSVKSTENVPIPFILPTVSILDKNEGNSVTMKIVTNKLHELRKEGIEKDTNSEDGKEMEGKGRDGGGEVRERERDREGNEKISEGCWAEGMCDALTLLLEQ